MIDLDEKILVLTTGGTFDKVYFDAKSEFEVGHSIVGQMLSQAEVSRPFELCELLRKDSLELTDPDRELIRQTVMKSPCRGIVITHGTDTMTVTAAALEGIGNKTIVMTGALAPARFAQTDAMFNLGMAFAAAQVAPSGVYIAMNGCIFDAAHVKKDVARNAFVSTQA